MATTFYWHDYETWGADPRRDRPAQFAGIRTDEDLNPVGDPLMIYCKPADDMLPQPEACLVTGITPQQAMLEGLCEAEFMGRIHAELARPGTCGVGYNSIRFDDEFTRFGLYRNFFDPYAREWQSGNSRWDIIDMVRLTHALRPEGIEWPLYEDGVPSFRLEHLTAANGIAHEGAHDALADVRATIALAQLIKSRQPRLYEYVYQQRDKRRVAQQLDLRSKTPVLHVSSMFPARFGCIAMVAPLARHPINQNGIIVYDLRYDPTPLIELDVEALRERLYTPAADLADGVDRLPLKTVHVNKCPVIVPMNTLTPAAAERWQIDVAAAESHLGLLRRAEGLEQKIRQIHGEREFAPSGDPDQDLYGGGFFSDADRRRMETVRATPPQGLAELGLDFDDRRLPEMLFRYRARNWPETLSADERGCWEEFRLARLNDPDMGGISIAHYRDCIERLLSDPATPPEKRSVLEALMQWGERLIR